jgi:predicted Zn-dependent protease with MMP-like domain
VPLPERGVEAPLEPDRITIFRRTLEAEFRDPAELEAQIRITVLHELAHYFGIDEDRLDELGYG